MLALDHVGKTYPNGVRAVHDLSLEVEPGEIAVIIGGSGCGKSTVLRLVCGLDQPTPGEVALDGAAITGPHEKIGVVFQEPPLFPWLPRAPHRPARPPAAGANAGRGPKLRWFAWAFPTGRAGGRATFPGAGRTAPGPPARSPPAPR